MPALKIAICYEPPPEEAAADLLDIEEQADFLVASLPGRRLMRLPFAGDAVSYLAEVRKADLAWNLFECFHGREEKQHLGAALLEISGRPYTGNGFETLCLLADKRTAKIVLASVGLPVPELYKNHLSGGLWMVKPARLHGSSGLDDSSVWPGRQVPAALEAGPDLFAEKYIDGDEYSATLLDSGRGLRTVAVARMEFFGYAEGKPRILSYESKWAPDSLAYRSTRRSFDLDPAMTARISASADKAAQALNLSGFARIDFRLDGDLPLIIDVNPNPGLGADSGFMAACRQAGIENPLEDIIKAALR